GLFLVLCLLLAKHLSMEYRQFGGALFHCGGSPAKVLPGHGEEPARIVHLDLALFSTTSRQGTFGDNVNTRAARARLGVGAQLLDNLTRPGLKLARFRIAATV